MNMETRERYKKRISDSVSINSAGCWLWVKTKSRNGYGTFALGGGNNKRAHRISYEVFVGPIPDGLEVCHKCDVRACVNPAHLFIGTHADNMADAAQKGRILSHNKRHGSDHPAAKLTDNCVETILKRLSDGEPKARLARVWNVSQRTILLIARGETWKHVHRTTA